MARRLDIERRMRVSPAGEALCLTSKLTGLNRFLERLACPEAAGLAPRLINQARLMLLMMRYRPTRGQAGSYCR